MRISTAACGGFLCLVALGCGSTALYTTLNEIDRTTSPAEIRILPDRPTRPYKDLGIISLKPTSYPPEFRAPDSIFNTFRQVAALHGADAVIVPYDEDTTATGIAKGDLSYRYTLEGLAIAWDRADTSVGGGTARPLVAKDSTVLIAFPYDILGGIKPPVELYFAKPSWPAHAIDRVGNGSVWVQALVGVDGRVSRARVLIPAKQSFGLEAAVLTAAKLNKYQPAELNGKPVAMWATYEQSFGLRFVPWSQVHDLASAKDQAGQPEKPDTAQTDSLVDSVGSPRPSDFVEADEPPLELYHEHPVYPGAAGLAGKSGTVWVQALVGTDGRVSEARILKPSGLNVGFEPAALEAAYRNRYRPAKKNGKPIAVWISYKTEFKFGH